MPRHVPAGSKPQTRTETHCYTNATYEFTVAAVLGPPNHQPLLLGPKALTETCAQDASRVYPFQAKNDKVNHWVGLYQHLPETLGLITNHRVSCRFWHQLFLGVNHHSLRLYLTCPTQKQQNMTCDWTKRWQGKAPSNTKRTCCEWFATIFQQHTIYLLRYYDIRD